MDKIWDRKSFEVVVAGMKKRMTTSKRQKLNAKKTNKKTQTNLQYYNSVTKESLWNEPQISTGPQEGVEHLITHALCRQVSLN